MTFTDWFPHDLKPNSPQLSPYFVELRGDKTYQWCSCGNSKTQPFCDGRHKGTGFKPIPVRGSGTFMLCGCKFAESRPFCNFTHLRQEGCFAHPGMPLVDF